MVMKAVVKSKRTNRVCISHFFLEERTYHRMNEALLVPSQITSLFEMGPENFHSGVSNVETLFVRLQGMNQG